MRILRALSLILMVISCSSCGSNKGESQEITEKIAYQSFTPGNAAPEIMYTESITVSGKTMTVERSGGAKVLSGTWQVTLNGSEITRINDLALQATLPDVLDAVYDNVVYDAPSSTLHVGARTFHVGIVNNQWHEFPAKATNLVNYIEELMVLHSGIRFLN